VENAALYAAEGQTCEVDEQGEKQPRLDVNQVGGGSRRRPFAVRRLQHRCSMSPHPVRFQVEPSRLARVHVVIRLALLAALAAIGCSSVYWLLYLAVPAVAALLVSRDRAERYLGDDAPGVIRVLRWLAGAYAYLWLLTDAMPTSEVGGPVELAVEVGGKPTANSALLRLVTSLPALLLLAILSMAAAMLWIVGAVTILATERVPAAITGFISMKLRYQFRFVAYHLSLVDAYPVLADSPLTHTPHSDAA
jgi:hypothetical protein